MYSLVISFVYLILCQMVAGSEIVLEDYYKEKQINSSIEINKGRIVIPAGFINAQIVLVKTKNFSVFSLRNVTSNTDDQSSEKMAEDRIQSQLNIDDTSVESHSVLALSTFSTVLLKPGVYESNDMEQILSFPLSQFKKGDVVIFDVDGTLKEGLGNFYHKHPRANFLQERLSAQKKNIIDKFLLYNFVSQPWVLMDEIIPCLIRCLQQNEVICLANTALHPSNESSISENVDIPLTRVQKLGELGIDFSEGFADTPYWCFENSNEEYYKSERPAFRDGVVFSARVPKSVTSLEFFERLNLKPRRVVFIDDSKDNCVSFFNHIKKENIECYSFFYTKRHDDYDFSRFFSTEMIEYHFRKLELFLEKLINGEDLSFSS